MKKIVLATVNARYIHTSIGLRYLYANLNELKKDAVIFEFGKNEKPEDIVESIIKKSPKIVGFGVYIWNAIEIQRSVNLLKQILPGVIILLGGPEVSHFPLRLNFDKADYIVQGEGDLIFYELCKKILDANPPKNRIHCSSPVDVSKIQLPYDYYFEEDIKNRTIYVESSRGCPFECEFCLSSIDKEVRYFDINKILENVENLWKKGVRKIKFVDRTFNLKTDTANKILDYFLTKEPPYLIHFEVIPEHFPDSLKEKLKMFPPASIQLEAGIQTLNPEVATNINRRMDLDKLIKNISFIEEETKIHLHTDLIVGLPGESLESFANNLNRLMSITKSEIQIGILKKLSGTELSRHDKQYGMVYSGSPPYEILQNDLIPYLEMQKMKRFARFWDLYYNSGNFRKSIPLIWEGTEVYSGFKNFSDWIFQNTLSTWQISLERLSELLFTYLIEIKSVSKQKAAESLVYDFLIISGRKLPKFLREFSDKNMVLERKVVLPSNKRQTKLS